MYTERRRVHPAKHTLTGTADRNRMHVPSDKVRNGRRQQDIVLAVSGTQVLDKERHRHNHFGSAVSHQYSISVGGMFTIPNSTDVVANQTLLWSSNLYPRLEGRRARSRVGAAHCALVLWPRRQEIARLTSPTLYVPISRRSPRRHVTHDHVRTQAAPSSRGRHLTKSSSRVGMTSPPTTRLRLPRRHRSRRRPRRRLRSRLAPFS